MAIFSDFSYTFPVNPFREKATFTKKPNAFGPTSQLSPLDYMIKLYLYVNIVSPPRAYRCLFFCCFLDLKKLNVC